MKFKLCGTVTYQEKLVEIILANCDIYIKIYREKNSAFTTPVETLAVAFFQALFEQCTNYVEFYTAWFIPVCDQISGSQLIDR